MLQLDDNTILQADATVIAGILILLTITYALSPRATNEVTGNIAIKTIRSVSWVAVITLIPFSVSAILIVLGSYPITITPADLGRYIMVVGFVALIIGISVLLGPKLPKSWTYSQKG